MLSPIFVAIPAFAVAPALIFVGLLMMGAVTHMDLSDDAAGMVSGFLAIVMMPFTYSIANGIMFGLLAFIIIRVFQKKAREIHPVMWVSGAEPESNLNPKLMKLLVQILLELSRNGLQVSLHHS